jgi:putative hydrolase of the HAD superfamily
MARYLFWDFDNTLAYRDGMWSQTILELLHEHGFESIGLETIRPLLAVGFPWHTPEIPHAVFFRGLPWWEYMQMHFAHLIEGLGIGSALAHIIADQIRDRYLDISRWHLYPDTIKCLHKALDSGYNNAILSNHVPELPDLAAALGIEGYFVRIFTSAIVGFEKPNTNFFDAAIASLGDCEKAVMIGDSYESDIAGALNVGLEAVLVRKDNIRNYSKYSSDMCGIFKYIQ